VMVEGLAFHMAERHADIGAEDRPERDVQGACASCNTAMLRAVKARSLTTRPADGR
jgi:hypothetical protein